MALTSIQQVNVHLQGFAVYLKQCLCVYCACFCCSKMEIVQLLSSISDTQLLNLSPVDPPGFSLLTVML